MSRAGGWTRGLVLAAPSICPLQLGSLSGSLLGEAGEDGNLVIAASVVSLFM